MTQSGLPSAVVAAALDRSCPICEGGTLDGLHTQRFVLPENHPLRNGYEVVACHGCGFVFANTPANQVDVVLSSYFENWA